MPRLPDWWDDHLAHLRSRPSPDGLRAMANAVAPGSTVERARRLGGGIGTATSLVRLRTRAGRRMDVVLKRYRSDGARGEWERLRFAQRLPVPTPEPLALDVRGTWFGAPALAMGRLPGRPDVRPSDRQRWIEEIAKMQIAIHGVHRMPKALHRPMQRWTPPDGLRRTALVEEAIAKLRRRVGPLLRRDLVVAHGDPHPGNLLWSRGRISGVADWQSARLAPRAHEVAYMRVDLAVLLGLRAADAYRDAYERLHGGPIRDLDVMDLVVGLNALRWSVLWVHPYLEQGADLTHERARRHALAFVRRAVERL